MKAKRPAGAARPRNWIKTEYDRIEFSGTGYHYLIVNRKTKKLLGKIDWNESWGCPVASRIDYSASFNAEMMGEIFQFMLDLEAHAKDASV